MKPHPLGFSGYRAHVYVIERHLLPGAPIPGVSFLRIGRSRARRTLRRMVPRGTRRGGKAVIAWGSFGEMALDESPLHDVAPLSSSSLSGGARGTPRPPPVALPLLLLRNPVPTLRPRNM